MEKLPENKPTLPTNTETANMSSLSHTPKQSDVSLARSLIVEIGGHCWNGKGDMLQRVCEACAKFARANGRKPIFTDRRIRGFFHREAARADYSEIVELAAVASSQKSERERLQNARNEHAEYINRVAATVHALNVSDAEFHRQSIEAISDLAVTPNVQQVGNAESKGNGHSVKGSPVCTMDCAGAVER